MNRLLIAILVPFVSLTGCMPRQALIETLAPTERVRRISLENVNLLSIQTTEFIASNGPEKVVQLAIEAARGLLKDPDSAKFRDVMIKDYREGKVICGEVNGKNSYGGYVGFSKFVASPYEATLYDNNTRYRDVWIASNAGIDTACSN